MIDKTNDIKQFIKKHYEPATIDDAPEELQLSSYDFLCILFQVFPVDCIDTDDLYNILTSLGYEPQQITPTSFRWCFKPL